jgi:DNA-binding MarR family transcriptional regulator
LKRPILAKKPAAPAAPVIQGNLLDLVGYNMKRAYMRLNHDFRQNLTVLDLRQRTFSVLSLVVENPDISQSSVARTLGIERSGTVVIIDELEGRNLLSREKVPGDRRTYALRATLDGQRLHNRALKKIKQREGKILASLTNAERDTLVSLLKRIHRVESEQS